MAKYRLVNCDFLNASFLGLTNKAKLLYLMMLINADDRGFVGNIRNIVNDLSNTESETDKTLSLELLENTYNSALNELLDKGYLYDFHDNYGHDIYLIRHWFFHNKYMKGLWTNYQDFMDQVHLEKNKYVRGKKETLKESKLNEINTNQNILNEDNIEEDSVSDDNWEDELPFR